MVEDRAGPQGGGDVLRADCDPGPEEAGPGLPEEVRRLLAQASLPRRRAARRADAYLDHAVARPAGDRSLLADRDRLAAALGGSRRGEDAAEDGVPELPGGRKRGEDSAWTERANGCGGGERG